MKKEKQSGILNIDKPPGKTSHDVVERVRALTGMRRVGHAGTLDPLATGVLVVCIGRMATRVVEYLMDEPKTYRTDVQLGAVTDTYDAEGEVIATSPVDVEREEVERALRRFRGVIEQVPPMYSAVKHEGRPLYHLARRGVEVERKPRRVEIHRLELLTWQSFDRQARCTLEIDCSPGTYVRVLVHDLGQQLGCGAYVTGLTRLRSGDFQLQDAVGLDLFAEAAQQGRWAELLRPVDKALAHRFPALHLDLREAEYICSGRSISDGARVGQPGELARVYGPEGRFLALAAYDPQADVWHPRKVFVPSYPGPGTGSAE